MLFEYSKKEGKKIQIDCFKRKGLLKCDFVSSQAIQIIKEGIPLHVTGHKGKLFSSWFELANTKENHLKIYINFRLFQPIEKQDTDILA